MIFKALFDRRRDWADIEELLRYGKVDIGDAQRWLTKIVGPDDARLAKLAAVAADVAGTR